jgi:(1->4)-alpha-D-glucan 1-alpha-D-glucosylmutase
VQLRKEFDFDAAAAVVPYIEELGVSHLYCSPYMQAAPHSPHGYDVVDPTRVSEALGGDAGLRRLDRALRGARIGQLLDIVPNHMCIADRANVWWWDVLGSGRASPYAPFFDIDWDAPGLHERVVLPVLGASRADVIAAGGLWIVDGPDGELELQCEGNAFPLAAGTTTGPGPASAATLEAQHYVLEESRTGTAHLNYRRFFDVSSLAGVRVEIPDVFDTVLDRALDLVAEGTVDGLRIDHIDGLRDPAASASRLRSKAPGAWLVAEKILATGELVPEEWPIDGTTGYEFGALLTSLLVHPPGLADLTDGYRDYTGDRNDFMTHSRSARREMLQHLLRAELDRLTRCSAAAGIVDAREELVELLASMPRYRIYPGVDGSLSPEDASAMQAAEDGARQSDRCDPGRLDAILAVLRGTGENTTAHSELRERFQQVAGAVMAKGVEDTAFYRYLRLVALNEVGSDPDRTAGLDEFHAACHRNLGEHPRTLLATTTHDSKRAEDVRVRIGMLSEMPDRWLQAVARLDVIAARHRGRHRPSRGAEYLLYQTLVGASPITPDRAWAYMRKAAREAKVETNWIEPNRSYEEDLERFVRGTVSDPAVAAEVDALVRLMTPAWQVLSLSQTLIKLTAPGIPDVYQGSELWDLRLVDPDNRTPVDYPLRHRMLREVMSAGNGDFMSRLEDGGTKLRLIATALAVRTRNQDGFGSDSGYRRLAVTGSRAEHAICFSRTRPDKQVATLTIALRWPLLLAPGWGDTVVDLPDGAWRDALTGHVVTGGSQRLETLLAEAPIALLERA